MAKIDNSRDNNDKNLFFADFKLSGWRSRRKKRWIIWLLLLSSLQKSKTESVTKYGKWTVMAKLEKDAAFFGKNGETLRKLPIWGVPRERKHWLFANQKNLGKKRTTGSDSKKWNGAKDSGKKPTWKTGIAKLEVTDNTCPFEPPKVWHRETWFFKPRFISETISYSKKN